MVKNLMEESQKKNIILHEVFLQSKSIELRISPVGEVFRKLRLSIPTKHVSFPIPAPVPIPSPVLVAISFFLAWRRKK